MTGLPNIGTWPLGSGFHCTDPDVATLNDTSQPWTCWRCKATVPPGGRHTCPVNTFAPMVVQPPLSPLSEGSHA